MENSPDILFFSRYAATGDGILTSLMVMEACVDKKSTLCDLAKEMKVYPQVLRNVRVADKKTARENPRWLKQFEAAGKGTWRFRTYSGPREWYRAADPCYGGGRDR